MKLAQLCKLTDLKTDTLFEVNYEGQSILLFMHNNEVKAYQGNCPHEGSPLIEGEIKNGHIICPMHNWEFSCDTGKRPEHNNCLESFSINTKDGNVYLDLSNYDKAEKFKLKTIDKTDESNLKTVRTIKDLPSPKGQLLFGNFLEFDGNLQHQVIEKWAKELDTDVFKISLVGKKMVVVTNPDFIKKVLKARPQQIARFKALSKAILSTGIDGLVNVEGDIWKRYREFVSEALNMKNVISFFPIVANGNKRLYERLTDYDKRKESIDILKEMSNYALDVISPITFGYSLDKIETEGEDVHRYMEKVFPTLWNRTTASIPIWRYYKSKKDRELDKLEAITKKRVTQFIEEAKIRLEQNPELKENPTNFLDTLIAQQDRKNGFNDDELYGNLMTLLLGGADTTSNALAWTFYYLAERPEVVEKVRNEADKLYGDDTHPKEYDLIKKLKYAENVAMEALRLKPVITVIFLEANEDVEIDGLFITKGTPIACQVQEPQTNAKYFFKPDELIPERWSDTERASAAVGCPMAEHRPDIMLAFGGGPRYCPGKNLAMIEMVSAISMICKNFDVELTVPKEEVKEFNFFALQPDNLHIQLKARNNQTNTAKNLEMVNNI